MKRGLCWAAAAVLFGCGAGEDTSARQANGPAGGPSNGGMPQQDPVQPAPTATGSAGDPTPPPTGSSPTEQPTQPYPYDPNVEFDWPETPPKVGDCLPGVYVGTFSCSMAQGGLFGLLGSGFSVTGPVRFTLTESPNGEFLEISDGLLEGTTQGTVFTSQLSGQLTCSTDTFHADAVNGTWGTPPFSGTFSGYLDAQLDRLTQTLNGQWALADSVMATPCIGPWSAVRQP